MSIIDVMRTYVKPQIKMIEADLVLLSMSEIGPGATDIDAPMVKSVWDEDTNDNETIDYDI